MRNKISAPVPWRKSIEGWTDTLRAAGLSAQTIKSRRYKMVHLAALLMPSGPEDVTTEQIVQVFARQQWKPETRKAYRNTISSFFRWLHKSGRRSDDLACIIMDARGYLFPGRFGGHVEESYIGDHISRLLPDGYAAHTLRHRFATTAYAATHDLFVVAELLGHESVETTEHYVAMPDGRLREATTAVRLDV